MGFYGDHILPRIIHIGMATKDFAEHRRSGLAGLKGTVLEVGFGSGLNLPFYPPEVTRLLALEPSELSRRLARRRIAAAPMPVEFVGLRGEEIPLDAASVDGVVTTWTLCTIPDAGAALEEIRRVLKPEGRFHFVEHGRSPDPAVARWQDRLTPIQKRLGGGCHLNRKIDALIEGAGLEILRLDNLHMRGPKFATYLYSGVAGKG